MERNEPRLAALLLTVTCAYDLPAQAPQLVLDINTRVRSTPSDPAPGAYVSPRIRAQFVTLLGETYFVAHRPDVGLELFATRGTAASTRLVADVYPGPDGAQPRDLTVVGLNIDVIANVWIPEPHLCDHPLNNRCLIGLKLRSE